MLKLADFITQVQQSSCNLIENGQLIVGGNNGDVNGDHTETGEDTVNCDYYATYDDEDNDCWRLDKDCCDPA